jgi:hypothetical protein
VLTVEALEAFLFASLVMGSVSLPNLEDYWRSINKTPQRNFRHAIIHQYMTEKGIHRGGANPSAYFSVAGKRLRDEANSSVKPSDVESDGGSACADTEEDTARRLHVTMLNKTQRCCAICAMSGVLTKTKWTCACHDIPICLREGSKCWKKHAVNPGGVPKKAKRK